MGLEQVGTEFINADQLGRFANWDVLEETLVELFKNRPRVPQRLHFDIEPHDTSLLLMPAWKDKFCGVKQVYISRNAHKYNLQAVTATYILSNALTGETLAIVDGDELTLRRTAAVSALASSYLARNDSKVLTIVGAGALAPYLAHSHFRRHRFEQINVWARRDAAAIKLAEQLREEGLPATHAANLEQVVRNSNVVCCATSARSPVVKGEWLREGSHLDLVGGFEPSMREVDDAAIGLATIFCDDKAACLAEAGDIRQPIEAGVIEDLSIRGDLADLVAGRCIGRTDSREITLFKSVGLAEEDLAVAIMCWKAILSEKDRIDTGAIDSVVG